MQLNKKYNIRIPTRCGASHISSCFTLHPMALPLKYASGREGLGIWKHSDLVKDTICHNRHCDSHLGNNLRNLNEQKTK